MKPRRPRSRGGFTQQPESQTWKFEGSGLQKHHQNSTRRPPREGRKSTTLGLEREKKKERNFGWSGGGGGRPAEGASSGGAVQRRGQSGRGKILKTPTKNLEHTTHTHTPTTTTHTTTPEILAKNTNSGQMRFGQMWSQKRPGQIRIFSGQMRFGQMRA